MAGERIGKTYEALLKVVFDHLIEKGVLSGQIYWNETPAGLSVEPDFIIGNDINSPQLIIMVTHSGSSKNSDMKCWRNIGELCEVKTAFPSPPEAINIIFDGVMKENLKKLQAAAFDAQIIVSDKDYGKRIHDWVYRIEPELPVNQEEKASAIKRIVASDTEIKEMLMAFATDLVIAFGHRDDTQANIWQLQSLRDCPSSPERKETFFRRGFTKRLLAGDSIRKRTVEKSKGEWLTHFGLVRKSVSGYRITDNELLWFIDSQYSNHYQQIASLCMSEGFITQIKKVQQFSLLEKYGEYVHDHYEELSTIEGMRDCIINQHIDPGMGLSREDGVETPLNVWIYDYIAALIKAKEDRAQAFGYSAFSTHPLSSSSLVGSMPVGQWCAHFACEYFNRKPSFVLPPEALNLVSTVLSERLASIKKSDVHRLKALIEEQYIAKEYEAILLAHRGFEPLFGLLIYENVVSAASKTNIRTCFAEKAGLTGQAGKTTIAKVKSTIINWQSAYDSGKDHKRKELCGRAIGLRYTWDEESKSFVLRPGIKKLILLLDGTWTQKDLDTLLSAGWDEIYYPDQLDRLKAAIV